MNDLTASQYTVSDVFESVGIDSYRAGDVDDAHVMLHAALEYAEREGENGERLLTKLNNLAVVKDALGELETAERLFQRALECVNNDLGLEFDRLPMLLCNYSILLGKRNEDLLSEGMSICSELIHSICPRKYPTLLAVKPNTTQIMEKVA